MKRSEYEVVRCDSVYRHYKPVARFESLTAARTYIRAFAPEVRDIFTPLGDRSFDVQFDIRFYSNGMPALLHPVDKELNSFAYYDELASSGFPVSKQSLVEKLYSKEAGEWDYALPSMTMDSIVERALQINRYKPYERHLLYRVLHGGLVWYYPRTSLHRIGGQPAAITSDAEELVLCVYGAYDE